MVENLNDRLESLESRQEKTVDMIGAMKYILKNMTIKYFLDNPPDDSFKLMLEMTNDTQYNIVDEYLTGFDYKDILDEAANKFVNNLENLFEQMTSDKLVRQVARQISDN